MFLFVPHVILILYLWNLPSRKFFLMYCYTFWVRAVEIRDLMGSLCSNDLVELLLVVSGIIQTLRKSIITVFLSPIMFIEGAAYIEEILFYISILFTNISLIFGKLFQNEINHASFIWIPFLLSFLKQTTKILDYDLL